MADNVTVPVTGTGDATPKVATDQIPGTLEHYQRVKLADGTADSTTAIAAGNGVAAGALRVTLASDGTGVVAVTDNGGNLSIDDGGNLISVDDGAGSLTVDNAALSQTGGGTEASALRVTLATDSTGLLSVDDNSGSLTVDSPQLPAALTSSGNLKMALQESALPAVTTVEAAYSSAQTDVAIINENSGNKIVVTRILVTLANSTSVDVGCRIGFGATSTPTTTGVVASHPGIPHGGGFNSGDGSGVLGIGAANEDLRITSDVPTGGALRVVVSYYLTT